MLNRRRILAVLVALTVLSAGAYLSRSSSRVSGESLPSRLSDQAFWDLITEFSEPNGYFRSDNFLSNETAFQRVLPRLVSTLPTGGVYLGVGPEQNFTYLVALRPRMAFIVDIRRGNLHEHLLYKAFIEISSDRADFLSRLFARPRPADVSPATPIDVLMDAYRSTVPSLELYYENLQAATDWLVKHHGFTLTHDDIMGLDYVYHAFYEGGPDLNYSFSNGAVGFGGQFPTYAELMGQTDDRGEQRSYLASEANFRTLAEMERANIIVPIVGNFSGPKALRSVGRYLKEHGATVTTFYTSNVEMYLFQQANDWRRFYTNVAALPLDEKSTFIRSVSNRGFRIPAGSPTTRSATRLSSMQETVTGVQRGTIRGYSDIVTMSN